jgi:hypothetical protein
MADPGSNGVVVRTALNTTVARTLTGTTDQITITNGDGVSGNPTISLPSAITTPGSLTTTGHLTPLTDSTYTNGDATHYWLSTSTDRLYVNSAAYIDGSVSGVLGINGAIGNASGDLTFAATSGYNVFYKAGTDAHMAIYSQNGGGENVQLTHDTFRAILEAGSGDIWITVPTGASHVFRNNVTTVLSISLTTAAFATDVTVPDEAYGAGWNGSLEVPTKNAVYDKIETMGGGSGITRTIATVTSIVTLGATASTDYVTFIGASGVVTLPTAVGNTNMYTLKNVDTTNKTISTTSSQTIDGTTTITLAPDASVDVVSDGSNWRIV